MNKKKFSRFNDGVAKIYREKDRRTNFSAKVNVSVLDDMDFVVRLDFQEKGRHVPFSLSQKQSSIVIKRFLSQKCLNLSLFLYRKRFL